MIDRRYIRPHFNRLCETNKRKKYAILDEKCGTINYD